MRYLSFVKDGVAKVGAVVDGAVVDVASALPGAPATIRGIIAAGCETQERIAEAVNRVPPDQRLPLSACQIAIPIPDTGKIVCLGLNYADHAKEGGHSLPGYPSLFLRVPTSLIAHGAAMVVPRCSEQLDYEAELMVVIGKRCRHVPEDQALDVVFGYTLFNDGSVREYQRRTTQWTAGKNFDRTGPVGPWIVTADELPRGAAGLRIRSRLGDRILQDSNTKNMIFSVAKTVSLLSEIMTLEPGDLIATGTPEGVGHARKPPLWLKPGDEITVEVEEIGALSNPVVAET
jgi:acylpyruvate hydrolase